MYSVGDFLSISLIVTIFKFTRQGDLYISNSVLLYTEQMLWNYTSVYIGTDNFSGKDCGDTNDDSDYDNDNDAVDIDDDRDVDFIYFLCN